MRKFAKIISLLIITSFLLSGCYGNFNLTKKLYNWNGQVGNKFVNSAVMWVLFIVPVYEVAGFIDFAILNVVQFWTGKNPMAMQDGEKEIQIVELDGQLYEITATKNRFDVKRKSNEESSVSLIFNEQKGTWIINDHNSNELTVAQLDKENLNMLRLIYPDGNTLNIDLQDE
jgi:Domain of unknown function (DUF3332)